MIRAIKYCIQSCCCWCCCPPENYPETYTVHGERRPLLTQQRQNRPQPPVRQQPEEYQRPPPAAPTALVFGARSLITANTNTGDIVNNLNQEVHKPNHHTHKNIELSCENNQPTTNQPAASKPATPKQTTPKPNDELYWVNIPTHHGHLGGLAFLITGDFDQ